MAEGLLVDVRLADVVWAAHRARPWPRILGGVGVSTGALVALAFVVPVLGLLHASHGLLAASGALAALAGGLLGYAFVRAYVRGRDAVRVRFAARGIELGGAYLSYEHVRRVAVCRLATGSVLRIETESGGYVLRAGERVVRDLDDGLARLHAANPRAAVSVAEPD